ncbi:hypothetical protein PVAND_000403 [Polypedilum vanderplanki]|uniref:2-amino-3-ketobutyrate coenzyme A ligase, mitochondrial n=1 Tax=Polypedilum vanderplanki TaxID=319348 RepID=A0A9J6BJQ8_POLVA|nr:hypothetical protein PVAND_000403 [Polypedilum vanderplanki]
MKLLTILNVQRLPSLRCYSQAAQNFRSILQSQLDDIKAAGTYKTERIITSEQKSKISVDGLSRKVINFCANNYLGLSANEEIKQYSKEMVEKYGHGLSSVRFICGTQNIHKELEAKISQFHQRDDTILYAACFDANAGIFEVILTPEDAVFSDELNHASIIDGLRLCKAQKQRYLHRDMNDLEEKLKASDARVKLIVSDGVFSMDGNIAPLPDIINLARKYNAITFLDDCHATGFFGKTGRGTEEYYDMMGSVDIINSTLGKALGGAMGGYTVGPKEVIELLRQKSRPYLFSNSLSPAIVGCGIKVMDMLLKPNDLVGNLQKNTKKFRDGMTKAGFKISGENHPISPVMLGDAKLAQDMANDLLSHGIYVIGFSFPVVPKGKARIRVQISAAHTEEEIDQAINAFITVGRKYNVIK